jgi:hypothetical protein
VDDHVDRWVVAYGTLRAPEVVEALLGRPVPARPGRVAGWEPRALDGLDYPVVVEAAGSVCEVDLIGPLSSAELALVVEWEGPWYRPATWVVDGVAATVFLPDLDHPELPARTGVWSYELFRSRDLAHRLEWMWD